MASARSAADVTVARALVLASQQDGKALEQVQG